MAKEASNKKTVISGGFGTPTRPNTRPIGFEPSFIRDADISVVSSRSQEVEIGFSCGQRAEIDNTIISVVRSYMEKRSEKCYRDGLDKEFMATIDKIFIKYYEQII